ncbi:MAG: hypothetical protein IJO05_02850 [Oscillospiraceae bacterium]|nr:hypothetical protein [Oscillospiraceae bacterium]
MKPERKHPRLKEYDYSLPGYYYVTICAADESVCLSRVGRGLAPAPASVVLTDAGKIAQEQFFALEQRYPYVRIDKYVIMPNHIHVIMELMGDIRQGTKRADLPAILCAYKSITTRMLNQAFGSQGKKWFQTSFYETVLRNEKAYHECWKYIDENPEKMILGYHR